MSNPHSSPSSNGSMRQSVFLGPRQLEIQEIPIPEPGPDQTLVEVQACALCTWEQRLYTGEDPHYPMAGGHEVSGVVVKVGERVFSVKPGDHVTVSGLVRCEQCDSCRRGLNNICENMYKVRDQQPTPGPAGLGEYVLRLGADCYKVDDSVPFEHAALTEPLSCVLRSIKHAQLAPGEKVVIIGAGIMGMLHQLLARRLGAEVFMSEPDAGRRKKALELGAAEVFNPFDDEYSAKVKALTGGRGADATFVCVTQGPTIEPALEASAPGGRVMLYSSFFPKGEKIQVDPNIFHKTEVVLTGSMSQSREDFFEAAQIISNQELDLSPLVSASFPLDDLKSAFEAALSVDTYRVIVNP
jgi:threonine dehydrogenase-like Zn-dependent dehydrogenase